MPDPVLCRWCGCEIDRIDQARIEREFSRSHDDPRICQALLLRKLVDAALLYMAGNAQRIMNDEARQKYDDELKDLR